jgi:hypothetical protein
MSQNSILIDALPVLIERKKRKKWPGSFFPRADTSVGNSVLGFPGC